MDNWVVGWKPFSVGGRQLNLLRQADDMKHSLLAILLLALVGCASSSTVVGYGQGETPAEATLAAWENARAKMNAGGWRNYKLEKDQLLIHQSSEAGDSWKTNIRFRVIER